MTDRPPALWRRTLTGLVPASEPAQRAFDRMKPGDVVRADMVRPRSVPWHRRYWALVSLVANNTSYTADDVHNLLKLECGCRKVVKLPGGRLVWVPDTISFAAMGLDEWAAYWDRVVAFVCGQLLPGVTDEGLRNELAEMVGERVAA